VVPSPCGTISLRPLDVTEITPTKPPGTFILPSLILTAVSAALLGFTLTCSVFINSFSFCLTNSTSEVTALSFERSSEDLDL
jgi:hypothetical protein